MSENNKTLMTAGKESFSVVDRTKEMLQLVSFSLADEDFGGPILKVQEINRFPEITRIPKAPDFVEGIINLRGRVVPVISLQKRFGIGRQEANNESRIIVFDLQGKTIGFTVDSVKEVIRVDTSVIEPPPAFIGGIQREYLSGVAKLDGRLLILLDLDKVLSDTEVEELGDTAVK